MNIESEKLCLEEIDHLVLDNDKKVTVTYISNNFNIPNKDSEVVLEKWIKKYTGDKQIAKEYLIRGTDLNGNSIITIVPEKNLSKVKKVCPEHTKFLYSIEVSSINGKSLNIQEPTENKYIGLKIKSEKRNVKVSKIVVPPVKKEPEVPKKPSNPFGFNSKPQSNDVKTEKSSGSNLKEVQVKEEKKSPQKTSPRKNQSSKATKAPPGKPSSIASFFAKPSTSSAPKADKSVSEAAAKIESVKIKDEVIVKDEVAAANDSKNANKRPHSNASDSNEDSKSAVKKNEKTKAQAKKKMKFEPKSARSRLMQICDSSSDEEDTSERKETAMEIEVEEEVVVKKEKENKTPSPDKSKGNQTNGSSDGKRRHTKVKKMVTRTYEDEDGFINTVREMEEVSCSEDEPEVIEPPPKKPAIANTSNAAPAASKKKISPPVGKKQGSILSFFGKK